MLDLRISKLSLKNFRNIDNEIIEFSPKINCILGGNGNGKTNVLEAIYLLANRKSFRKNNSFAQYLNIDVDEQEIYFSSIFEDENFEKVSYSGKLFNSYSEWFLNGKPRKNKLPLNVVFINPFDSYNFFNNAQFRRNWINQHLSQLDSDYKKTLSKYNSVLKNRNKLLSHKPNSYELQIDALDEQMADYIKFLTARKQHFLFEMQTYCERTFNEIFSENHKLTIELDSLFLGKDISQIKNILNEKREKDKIIGYTTAGSHKDDYIPYFDGINAFDYCSLGQQKMSYLSLVFSFINLMIAKLKARPIVLIDDVSGELDKKRWSNLVKYLEVQDFQVLITTANESFKTELEKIQNTKKIYIDSGSISYQ